MGDSNEASESDEPSGDDMKRQAADDAFDAVKSGDRDLFAEWLGEHEDAVEPLFTALSSAMEARRSRKEEDAKN